MISRRSASGALARYLQAHHLAAAAALERHLEFPHEVFGLVLHFEIAVAKHAEGAMALGAVSREHPVKMQQQQFLEWQIPHFPRAGQRHETPDLVRNGQQGAQAAIVGAPLELQRQRKALARDEGKRMCRVDRQWRQDREDIVEKLVQ